jgi:hypothetical protein
VVLQLSIEPYMEETSHQKTLFCFDDGSCGNQSRKCNLHAMHCTAGNKNPGPSWGKYYLSIASPRNRGEGHNHKRV